jgi:hypothetical protein
MVVRALEAGQEGRAPLSGRGRRPGLSTRSRNKLAQRRPQRAGRAPHRPSACSIASHRQGAMWFSHHLEDKYYANDSVAAVRQGLEV